MTTQITVEQVKDILSQTELSDAENYFLNEEGSMVAETVAYALNQQVKQGEPVKTSDYFKHLWSIIALYRN